MWWVRHYFAIMTNQEHVDKMVNYVNTDLKKYTFSDKEITFCKSIQIERDHNKFIYNSKHKNNPIRDNKISRWHDDKDLYFGLLCELLIVREFGNMITSVNIMKLWAEDQINQNKQLLKFGCYDCKDIGHTQVRAAEYSESRTRNIIYRENDFRSKSTQPLIGCIINTQEHDLWAVICGFITYDELKTRKVDFWKNPDGRGAAMFIPVWELTPMSKFDVKHLL